MGPTPKGKYAEDEDTGYSPEYLATLTPNDFAKAKLVIKVQ